MGLLQVASISTANLTIQGIISANGYVSATDVRSNTFTGNSATISTITAGNVTGNVIGNLTGNVTGNLIVTSVTANGSVGSNNQVLISQGPGLPSVWSNSSVSVNSSSIIGGTTNRLLFNSNNTIRETTGITTDGVTLTLTGSTSALSAVLSDVAEVINVSATAATGNINFDVTSQSVLYYTSNATSNWNVNFRGSSTTQLNTLLSNGQCITVVFMTAQGATPYFSNTVQIDGSSVTPRYQGATAPTAGNANSVDIYSYTIVKTSNAAFSVFASQTSFA